MRSGAIGARLAVAALAVAAALGLALAACGGGSTRSGTVTASAAAGSQDGTAGALGGTASGSRDAPSDAGAGRGDPRESSCQAQVGGFVHSLATLRRRLVAGLAYEQYVSEMRAIRSTYEAVPVARLDVTCLTRVGGPAESSFNTYLDAGNDWGDCVGTPGCEAATVEPTLQRKWRAAAKALGEAQAALRASPTLG